MKNFILLIFLASVFTATSQQQFNNFEINKDLDIIIGPEASDSIWQIGVPNKIFFDSAFSKPNALMTDSLLPYGNNLAASFTILLNESSVFGFPFLQIQWNQKIDSEEGKDGGIIEVSYDNGQTWLNIFDDPNYTPDIVGFYTSAVLSNGQTGITGTSDWLPMGICWGSANGTAPTGFTEILVRFTFISDNVDTQQEGWMIDDFASFNGVIGSTATLETTQATPFYPNPAQQTLNIEVNQIDVSNAEIEVFDIKGIRLLTQTLPQNYQSDYALDITSLPQGAYFFVIKNKKAKLSTGRFIKE